MLIVNDSLARCEIFSIKKKIINVKIFLLGPVSQHAKFGISIPNRWPFVEDNQTLPSC